MFFSKNKNSAKFVFWLEEPLGNFVEILQNS